MSNDLNALILDDCEDDRVLVEQALAKAGVEFRSTWAQGRAGYLRALDAARPDIILVDNNLPDIDGPEALQIASRMYPDTPVIAVTGDLSDESAARLLLQGADDYVLKDRLARLGPAVLAAVERAKMQRAARRGAARHRAALLGTIEAISRTLEKRDPYTAGHQDRVADLAARIGLEMRLGPQRVEGLRLGAQIHDIGKIYVPSEILARPGTLTAAEFALVKTHPQVGYDIVKDVNFPWPVARMVLEHHERLDGTGYPHGLKGDGILTEARIIAVADVLEAMTSHRPYRPGLPLESALGELESRRGTHFDPCALDACLRIVRRAPAFARQSAPHAA